MAFAETAVAESVDAAILAGDVFHVKRPGPVEIMCVVKAIRCIADAGIPVIYSRGNHESAAILGGEGTTLAWMAALDLPNVHVVTEPSVINLGFGTFAVLPYVSKRSVDSVDTLNERTAAASQVLADQIARMADDRYVDLPHVFVGHLTVTGAMLGSEAAMQLGWDPTVAPEAFDPYDLACLGHIHRRQVVSERAFYAGSPDVHGFDDQPAEHKGWWLHDTDADTHRFIPSRPRAFVTVQEADLDAMDAVPPGAVVRLILAEERTPAGIRDAVRLLKDAGASYVRIVAPEKRTVRRTQQAADVTPRAQMEEWLSANKYPLEPALAIAEEVMA